MGLQEEDVVYTQTKQEYDCDKNRCDNRFFADSHKSHLMMFTDPGRMLSNPSV